MRMGLSEVWGSDHVEKRHVLGGKLGALSKPHRNEE